MLPPDPRTFKDLYVVFELLESDLHTVIGANDDLTHDHHKVCISETGSTDTDCSHAEHAEKAAALAYRSQAAANSPDPEPASSISEPSADSQRSATSASMR